MLRKSKFFKSSAEVDRQHGKQSDLFKALNRKLNLMAALNALLVLAIILIVIFQAIKPVPTAVIDEHGNFLGQIDWLSPNIRSENEIDASVRMFATYYNSLNSATIYQDTAAYLNVMSEVAKKERLEELQATTLLAQIEASGASARVVIDDTEFLSRGGDGSPWASRVNGHIVIDGLEDKKPVTFSMIINYKVVARTTKNTLGLKDVEVNSL